MCWVMKWRLNRFEAWILSQQEALPICVKECRRGGASQISDLLCWAAPIVGESRSLKVMSAPAGTRAMVTISPPRPPSSSVRLRLPRATAAALSLFGLLVDVYVRL